MTSYYTSTPTTSASADTTGYAADTTFSDFEYSGGLWETRLDTLDIRGMEEWWFSVEYFDFDANRHANLTLASGTGTPPISYMNVVNFSIMGSPYAAVTYVRDGVAHVDVLVLGQQLTAYASYTISNVTSIDAVYYDHDGNLVIKTTSSDNQAQHTAISSDFDSGEPPVINDNLSVMGDASAALLIDPSLLGTDPDGDDLTASSVSSSSGDVLVARDADGGFFMVWGGATSGLLAEGETRQVSVSFSLTDGINTTVGSLQVSFSGAVGSGLNLTHAQALALEAAGYRQTSFSDGYTAIVMSDTAEAIESRGIAPLSDYASLGITEIAVSDAGALAIDYATAVKLADVDIDVTGASKLSVTLTDTDVADLMAMETSSPSAPIQLFADFASFGATAFSLSDHSALAFNLASLSALHSSGIDVEDEGRFALLDSSDTIAGLQASDIAVLRDLGVTALDAVGDSLSLSAGLVNKLGKAGLVFTAADAVEVTGSYAGIAALVGASSFAASNLHVDQFSIEDGASVIGALSAAKIAQLGSAGPVTIDIVEDALVLSASQIAAFEEADITFAADDVITTRAAPAALADTVSAFAHDLAIINVLANDSGSLPSTVASASVSAGNASVLVAADGRLVVDYAGADIDRGQTATVEVSYSISDGIDSADGLLTVTFSGVNENGDLIRGTSRAERISGTTVDDVIEGLAGADTISGLAGNDTITGGTGNDQISGGVGADLFIFSAKGGKDAIADFTHDADRIDLSAIAPITDFRDIVAHHVVDHGNSIDIMWGKGQGISLKGISDIDQLDRGDFIFG